MSKTVFRAPGHDSYAYPISSMYVHVGGGALQPPGLFVQASKSVLKVAE